MAGIKFHRQCYKLKQHNQRKQQNPAIHQRSRTENQPQDQYKIPCIRAKLRNRNDGLPNFNRGISDRMLYRMSAFMGCNANGCNRCRIIDRIRKPDDIGSRVVVVRQASADPFNLDELQSVFV